MLQITLLQTGLWTHRAWQFLTFQYDFVMYALAASVLVGAVCAVVGTFLVLRGMSLLGDAAGHATLPGVCIGFAIVGAKSMGALLAGAVVSGFIAAVLVGVIARAPRTKPDAAIGVVLSVFFGLGIVLLSYVQNSSTGAQAGLDDFLFGNAAGVAADQLVALAVMSALLLTAVVVFFRPLVVTIFDGDFARSLGWPTMAIEFGLLGALSIAVVISIQAVGVVLVAAMLIIPPSAALLLARRIHTVVWVSAGIGVASGAAGALLSFVFSGVATGPAMVLVAATLFAGAGLFGRRGFFRRGGESGRLPEPMEG
jgi:manganese/zinc/iron transport system permease protein